METNETSVKKEFRGPRFRTPKAWFEDIVLYWLERKFKNAKENFLVYIRSKQTHKRWINFGIVVAVFLLIWFSMWLKTKFDIYPYSENDYLNMNAMRTKITAYSGASGYNRLETFFSNVSEGVEDSIRIVYDVRSYKVVEDIVYDGTKIIVTTDNTRVKVYDKDKRVKVTKEYISGRRVYCSSGDIEYNLVDAKGDEYLIVKSVFRPET